MRWTPGFFSVALVLAAGCTSFNKPLDSVSKEANQRVRNHTRAALSALPPNVTSGAAHDSRIQPATAPTTFPADPNRDGYFVGIAISGGGSRSANFSAACLFQLHQHGLLQRADYISSVSGGSLTAAWYCVATDAEWNPANAQKKLTYSFATEPIVRMFLPWNTVALMFSDWDRSDLLADSFQKVLYSRDGRGLTFADLRPDRPRLLINATDLQSGKSFVFCNETFDQINSDLSSFPIAYAVTASSAVPVLLHQVTLRDFSTTFKQYRHLVDGGVVDNLGVKTLVETYRSHVKASNGSAYPNGAVFIVLDARTQYDARISSRGDTSLVESISFSAGLSSTVLINRASSATLAEIILDSAPDDATAAVLRQEREELINGGFVKIQDAHRRPVYVLHLALSRVNDIHDLPFKSFNESVNNIATYFNIEPSEAHQLYQAADLLCEKRFPNEINEISRQLNGPTTQP